MIALNLIRLEAAVACAWVAYAALVFGLADNKAG
jgi:hypothetical protein